MPNVRPREDVLIEEARWVRSYKGPSDARWVQDGREGRRERSRDMMRIRPRLPGDSDGVRGGGGRVHRDRDALDGDLLSFGQDGGPFQHPVPTYRDRKIA